MEVSQKLNPYQSRTENLKTAYAKTSQIYYQIVSDISKHSRIHDVSTYGNNSFLSRFRAKLN